jgi:hypothetical protein
MRRICSLNCLLWIFASRLRLNGPIDRASSEEGSRARSGRVRGVSNSPAERGLEVVMERWEVRRDVSVFE